MYTIIYMYLNKSVDPSSYECQSKCNVYYAQLVIYAVPLSKLKLHPLLIHVGLTINNYVRTDKGGQKKMMTEFKAGI